MIENRTLRKLSMEIRYYLTEFSMWKNVELETVAERLGKGQKICLGIISDSRWMYLLTSFEE